MIYRLYRQGPRGRLQLAAAFDAAADAAAIEQAGELIEGQAAELWQGGRLLGRISDAGDFIDGVPDA